MAHKIEIEGVIGWHDRATPEYLSDQLQKANGGDAEIHFNSPGGLVGAGLKMYNLIRNYTGQVTAVLSGYAMSMASYIPQACDVVMAEDNAVYMIHNARGGVWDDHNGVLKYGNYLKGLSGITARELAKQTAKRGKAKTVEEVQTLMDAETFFFGQEMLDHGFVDSIIQTEESDKETALAGAQAAFGDAVALMASDQARVRADLQLAMQLFDADPKMLQQTTTKQPPAASAAGTTKEEEGTTMSLKALLAANPSAQAEFDAAISAAEAKGKATGKEEMQATAKAVSNFLGNKEYPAQVGEMALKVLTGEQSKANLDMIVSMADMMKEQQKGNAAADGTNSVGETQGQGGGEVPVANATDVSSQADLEAAVAQFKEGGN